MRRARPLTQGERWELTVLLFLFLLAFAGLTAAGRSETLRRIVAFSRETSPPSLPSGLPIPDAPITLIPDPPAAPNVEPLLPPPAPPAAAKPKPTIKPPAPVYHWFNGQKYRYVRTIRLQVTAYAPDPRCCWPYDGTTTASGLSVRTNRGKLVAADTHLLPFSSLVSVPGYHGGETVPVLDRGGAIKGHRLDVLLPTYEQARRWGSRLLEVKVYLPVDD